MLPAPQSVLEALESRGVSRRQFLEFCGLMVSILGLPAEALSQVSNAVANAKKPVLVWLEFQDCAGNTESMLRASHPSVADVVLDLLSWEYHETIMAGAGKQATDVLDRVVRDEKGKFVCVVEGSIPTADGGVYCTIGGKTALDIARAVCPNAAFTIAAGACAWDGGLVRAAPNPTGAVGVQEAVPQARVVNLGGCPHNVANTAALLVHYLTFGHLPALDAYSRPLFAYGRIIHDQCQRRAHFDAGRFVREWGDEGHRAGWCLYKMGCKGPSATYNCPMVRWNDGTSWPVQAGHGCIACAAYRFWDTRSPFYDVLPNVGPVGADKTAEKVGVTAVAVVAGATVVHGIISAVRDRTHTRPIEETPPPEKRP